MSSRHLIALSAAAALAAAPLVVAAAPAQAATDWQRGQCFELTAEELKAPTVPDVDPVSCSGPHNIEVFYSGAVPVSNEAELAAAAKQHCRASQQFAAAGLPVRSQKSKPANAYWANPQLWYWISNGSDHLVCAIGLAKIVKGTNQALELTKPIRKLMSVKAASRYAACINGISAKRSSVPCKPARRPIPLTMFKVVNLSSKFTSYPGKKAMRALAGEECLSDGTWSAIYPQSVAQWKAGGDLLKCFERIA
jgi:hypothetical protein